MEIEQNTITEETLTKNTLANYELLANLFVYPKSEMYKQEVKNVYDYLQKNYTPFAPMLEPFVAFVKESSIVEIQELFLRSFDLQALTTLDIGFILFGEDYKRGKLLVHLNEEHKKACNICETELADHLPNLLNLLPKIEDVAMQTEIAQFLLLPALEKMIDEFSIEKIEKKDSVYKKHQKVLLEYSQNYRTIYQSCVWALFLVMQKDFNYEPTTTKRSNNNSFLNKEETIKDFCESIESEMLTEK